MVRVCGRKRTKTGERAKILDFIGVRLFLGAKLNLEIQLCRTTLSLRLSGKEEYSIS